MAGSVNNDIILIDDDTSSTATPTITRSPLMSILTHMEMDPTSQDAWIDRALVKFGHPGSSSLLDIFKNEEKKQIGGFIDTPIGPDTFNTVIAPPQAGKTQQILFSVMEAAYDMGVLSVIGVMNSILETPRFRATADKINLIISRVAGEMGIPLENTPVLRIFDDGSTVTYGRALAAWGKGSNVIPVFVVMMNNVKFNRFQEDLLVAISGTVGRDDKGRRKIMLVVDEADLQYKTENNSSQLEKSIFSRKISLGGDHFDSLYGAFTTIINVTATPQAIATGDVDFGGRRPVVYEPEPSSTNFQYHKKPLWKNKIITRVTTDSKEEMYEDMVKDENNRIALVYESANCKVSGRSTAASSTAKDLSEYPGLVTFAWSSNKIEIFTADRYWIDLFDGAEQGVFTRKPLDKGVVSFTGTKSISSYPDVIHYMSGRTAGTPRCKFILFAKEMTDRAIPVKGKGHEWPLTDMWIEAPKIPQEARVQVCGRLAGIDPIGTVKKLWCSEEEHEIHKKAIDTVQYIVDKLFSKGIGAREAIEKTRKTLVDLTEDTPIVSKIVVDEEGAISHLGGVRISRPSAGKRVRDMAVETKRMVKDKKMKLESETYDSGIAHAEVPAYSDASIVSDEVEVSVGPLVDPDTLAQMREASAGESGLGVVGAIKEVIRDNGGSVESHRVPTDMASRDSFPDGLSFSPAAFLKFLIREKMDLLVSNGIRYSNNVFSEL